MPNDTERLDFLEANADRIIYRRIYIGRQAERSWAVSTQPLDPLEPIHVSKLAWYSSLRALADAHLGADGQESEIARQWDEYFAAEG